MHDEPLPPLWGKVGMGGAAARLSTIMLGNARRATSASWCVLPDARAASPPIQLRLSSLRSLRLRILPPQGGKRRSGSKRFELASEAIAPARIQQARIADVPAVRPGGAGEAQARLVGLDLQQLALGRRGMHRVDHVLRFRDRR